MKLLFEKLAEELENTTFKCEDYIVEGAGFSNLPISVYSLEVIYNQNKIIIENELGNHNFGKVEMVLKDKNLPEFEITNVNHFVNLFLRKKNMFNVKSSNLTFKKYLEEKLIDSNLEQIAKDNLFEPKITNKKLKFDSHITTIYHLEFPDKIGAIKVIVKFYKYLIDY